MIIIIEVRKRVVESRTMQCVVCLGCVVSSSSCLFDEGEEEECGAIERFSANSVLESNLFENKQSTCV